MAIQQNFLAYHQSVGQQLQAEERRIRDLIGSSHWATDGAHKEAILRKVIKNYAPEVYRVGTGFVCYPGSTTDAENSSQIDILITSKASPTLYRTDDLQIVTPECVKAVIEVKTSVSNGQDLDRVIARLSEDAKNIRTQSGQDCWAGLFIYNQNGLGDHDVLQSLQRICTNDASKAVNCIAIGNSRFIRFWPTGHPVSSVVGAAWHSYEITALAHAYFASNLVSFLSPGEGATSTDAWFPIQNTKEVHRQSYAKLGEEQVHSFAVTPVETPASE
jgi:hypothetical protein